MALSSQSLVNKPSLIEYQQLRFLIMDAPRDTNLHLYIRECKKYNAVHLVRISEPTYNEDEVEAAGIQFHDMFYPDGQCPPLEVIRRWLEIVQSCFQNVSKDEKVCIAVHCIAGLGRAPVLVAIALIEYGFDAISAVTLIRGKRRGAINATQLAYLESYKRTRKSKKDDCTIM